MSSPPLPLRHRRRPTVYSRHDRQSTASKRPLVDALFTLAKTRRRRAADRSEEHTSELQSLMRISYAVFCLNKNKLTYYCLRLSEKHIRNQLYRLSAHNNE